MSTKVVGLLHIQADLLDLVHKRRHAGEYIEHRSRTV